MIASTVIEGGEATLAETILRVVSLSDYNTRIVVLATTMLGVASGLIGSFMLLRKRALMGDALSHAALPGIALAFLIAPLFRLDGKSLGVLLFGAAATGLMGMGAILMIHRWTKIKEDAAMAMVLSVFFGAGLSLLGVIQKTTTGHAAGLESFIFGKTASIIASDAWLIAAVAMISILTLGLLWKELVLLCFDQPMAVTLGYPTLLLDAVLMAVVVLVTMVGLQAVGLVLIIALLVIPAAAARFWSSRMLTVTWIAALLGATSCLIGAQLSGIFPHLPSGAVIVLVATFFFVLSLFFGGENGLVTAMIRRSRLARRLDRRHVLRGIYECLEQGAPRRLDRELAQYNPYAGVLLSDLQATRSWSGRRMRRELRHCEAEGLLEVEGQTVVLTAAGWAEAARLTHEHRLWELFLISYADVAPSKVDRDADRIEHVLEPAMIAELERLLQKSESDGAVMPSPHEIGATLEPAGPSATTVVEGH